MKEENETLTQLRDKIDRLKEEQFFLEKESMKILNTEGGEGVYTIRPAGRHVLTIGEELIQDQYAAIVELVKNAYDADSVDVEITFRRIEDILEIIIEDHGHGMSAEDIVGKWLVPSTNNKLTAKKSPMGRTMQGRKGIGRYAASILGDDFAMQTVTQDGKCSRVSINWRDFNKYTYLDQVDIKVMSEKTNLRHGTLLCIKATGEQKTYWTDNKLAKLRFELKRLVPPKSDATFDSNFQIRLNFVDFYDSEDLNVCEIIEPYPILDYFDYRISGNIDSSGKGLLYYENQKIKNSGTEEIPFNCGATGCGALKFDIRVYDRDKESIELLILRGLKDQLSGNYITKLEARRLIDSVNGIGVYRNGFRIRPLGDADFDWLKLNEQRVQDPSRKIGSNQVAGYVQVESEELSHLEEKSARDGLKDNHAYSRLRKIAELIIIELETRRFLLRRKLELSHPKKKIEKQLNGLYDYSDLKKSVSSSLQSNGLSNDVVESINRLIETEQEKKNEVVDEIKKAVAIYQGQATLGKIINIILHEGRRPLNYFRNQIPNLNYYERKFESNKDEESAKDILEISDGILENSQIFVNLFSRLDPLASKRRETKSKFSIKSVLLSIKEVFSNEMIKEGIEFEIICDDDVSFNGWKQDFYTIFTNLVDNSVYWMVEKKSPKRLIKIYVDIQDEKLNISYHDSGPGISKELLESGVIFEPEFSTKINGTGLGLAIAGEAAERNGLELTALQEENGAYFMLQSE